jgi:AcrR family transcriptional regulator
METLARPFGPVRRLRIRPIVVYRGCMAQVSTVGRRERKKQQTRELIAREGLRLFEQQGFKETTIAQIAEAADVAQSTFFLHFPCKEDVVFAGHADEADALVTLLEARGGDTTTLDLLRDYLHDLSTREHWDAELWTRRADVIRSDPGLRALERTRWADVVQPALQTSYTRDFPDGDVVRAPLLASMTLAAMVELGHVETELEEARAGGAAWKRTAVDRVLAALEAAAQALDKS